MPSSACDWSSDVCSSDRSEEHTSELQSRSDLVCRLLLEKKKKTTELNSRSELVCPHRMRKQSHYGGEPTRKAAIHLKQIRGSGERSRTGTVDRAHLPCTPTDLLSICLPTSRQLASLSLSSSLYQPIPHI